MNLRYENKLRKKGYNHIAGFDEAGRGSWAGPVVAGAVILKPNVKLHGLKDSKKLSSNQRQNLFLQIVRNAQAWAVGVVSHNIIDEIGILQATHQAFIKALEKLDTEPDYLIFDGVKFFKSNLPHEFLIRADDLVASVSAASIIAKVVRDQILNRLHQDFPEYNFVNNKGYGTVDHATALENYGLTEIHRLSYKPIEQILLSQI